jgi:hypothetical protein
MWVQTAWRDRAALSLASVKSLGLLSGDALGQVLHKGYGQFQAQSLCGVLGRQPGVAGGAESATLVLSPGFVCGLKDAGHRAVCGVGAGFKRSQKAEEWLFSPFRDAAN